MNDNVHPKDQDPQTIPFIFKNKEYTKPANQILHDWMSYFAHNDIEVLRFLFNKCQYYAKFGGARASSWAKWQTKVIRDLKNHKEF